MAEEGAPVIIKRVKKVGGAHHGGAWKVAYADFVTAMMAFFLLLWLLNSVTEEQLQGISNYFAPTTVSQSPTGAGGMLGGRVVGEGASQSISSMPTVSLNLPPSTIGSGGQDFTDPQEGANQEIEQGMLDHESMAEGVSDKEYDIQQELQQFDRVAAEIRQAIQSVEQLQALQQSLVIELTPEGLRIQIVDQEGLPMFPAGSSAMYEHTRKLLELVAKVAARLPQKIAIDGHTDGTGYTDAQGYGNWELSADRALASRRVLIESGLSEDRIERVAGRAATDLLLPENPESPQNRRISITILRESTQTPRQLGPIDPPPLPSIINGR